MSFILLSLNRNSQSDRMAERSKALVLGTSHFGGVGTNPTPVTFFYLQLFAIGMNFCKIFKIVSYCYIVVLITGIKCRYNIRGYIKCREDSIIISVHLMYITYFTVHVLSVATAQLIIWNVRSGTYIHTN